MGERSAGASYASFRIALTTSRRSSELTPAEREIAIALTRGWSSASLARHRGASAATIANQIASVFDKVGVHSRMELASRLADAMLGPAMTSSLAPRRASTSEASARVLVVEDTPRTREEVVSALVRAGYHVTGVEDLDGARRALTDAAPDVVLSDVRLGAESGLQLLIEGVALTCPVLLMSGAAELDEAIEGLALGAWDFVDKAWGIERLRLAVGEALGGVRVRRPVPAAASDAVTIDPESAARELIDGTARFVGALEHERARHVMLERDRGKRLQERERFAIGRVLRSVPTKAIAFELNVSEVTAWKILHDAIEKLGFVDRIEAMACLTPLAPFWSDTVPQRTHSLPR